MSLVDLMKQAQIAAPCSADWDSMIGDQKSRLCGQCDKQVLNASAMTDAEVLEVLTRVAAGTKVCMKLYRRADGTFLTRDCPVGLQMLSAEARRAAIGARRVAAWLAGGFSIILSLSASAQTATPKCGTGTSKQKWHSTIQSGGDTATQVAPAAGASPLVIDRSLRMMQGEMSVMSPNPPAAASKQTKSASKPEETVAPTGLAGAKTPIKKVVPTKAKHKDPAGKGL